jgi:hypothetical protein
MLAAYVGLMLKFGYALSGTALDDPNADRSSCPKSGRR